MIEFSFQSKTIERLGILLEEPLIAQLCKIVLVELGLLEAKMIDGFISNFLGVHVSKERKRVKCVKN